MKRIFSIFLVFLMLFNALGIYGLLQGLRFKSTRNLVQRLDNQQYEEAETFTIKVPIAIPYQSDSETFQRVDGEIEHNGEFYRLVKQKFQRDTLFIVCIKDHESTRIKQALTDYVKSFTDKPIKHTGKQFISFIKDFLPTYLKILHGSDGWNYSISIRSFPTYFYDRTLSVVTPPPRV